MKTYLQFIKESYQHSVSPLYHGTGKKFDEFDFNRSGKDLHILSFLGIHFSESPEVAEEFLKPPDFILYEVELNYNKYLDIKEGDLVKNMYQFGFDFEHIVKQFNLDKPYYQPKGDDLNSITMNFHEIQKTASEYKTMLIERGYDCIRYINEIESPHIQRYDWIAFYPNQIKIINVYDQKPRLKES